MCGKGSGILLGEKLRKNGIKKVAIVSELMNSEDPKEEAIMILKRLSHEN